MSKKIDFIKENLKERGWVIVPVHGKNFVQSACVNCDKKFILIYIAKAYMAEMFFERVKELYLECATGTYVYEFVDGELCDRYQEVNCPEDEIDEELAKEAKNDLLLSRWYYMQNIKITPCEVHDYIDKFTTDTMEDIRLKYKSQIVEKHHTMIEAGEIYKQDHNLTDDDLNECSAEVILDYVIKKDIEDLTKNTYKD